MERYFVELDGVSIIEVEGKLNKGDAVTLHEVGEVNYYRVRSVEGGRVVFRLMKVLGEVTEGVRYEYGGQELYFENRLSKNQTVQVNGKVYIVKDIQKKTNILTLEEMESTLAYALYGVYKNRSDEGLTVRDRETGDYVAEAYYRDWGAALRHVSEERSKGSKMSL